MNSVNFDPELKAHQALLQAASEQNSALQKRLNESSAKVVQLQRTNEILNRDLTTARSQVAEAGAALGAIAVGFREKETALKQELEETKTKLREVDITQNPLFKGLLKQLTEARRELDKYKYGST